MQSTFFFALVGLLRILTLAVVFTRCPTLRVDCAEAATGTERASRQKTIANFFNILKISPLVGPGPSDAECSLKTIRPRRIPNGLKNAAICLKKVNPRRPQLALFLHGKLDDKSIGKKPSRPDLNGAPRLRASRQRCRDVSGGVTRRLGQERQHVALVAVATSRHVVFQAVDRIVTTDGSLFEELRFL